MDLNSGNIDVPPNMTSWASFHNGVAAGLKIAPASQIDSAWIVYNKPKHAELANEYAGFLMALGLNGHLTKLATLNIHDYLTTVRTRAAGSWPCSSPRAVTVALQGPVRSSSVMSL